MAVDRRRVVVHVRWRRAHIGWRRGVMHIMLSPLRRRRRRRHRRLPMRHRRQMMVYHVQAGGVGCLAGTGAMRNEKHVTSNRLGAIGSSRLRRHAACKEMNGWSVVLVAVMRLRMDDWELAIAEMRSVFAGRLRVFARRQRRGGGGDERNEHSPQGRARKNTRKKERPGKLRRCTAAWRGLREGY